MADLVCGAQQRHPFCGTYTCELVYGHDGDHQTVRMRGQRSAHAGE